MMLFQFLWVSISSLLKSFVSMDMSKLAPGKYNIGAFLAYASNLSEDTLSISSRVSNHISLTVFPA